MEAFLSGVAQRLICPSSIGNRLRFMNPFLLRILKRSAARTLLLAMVTFATLLFSGCANGGYIYTSGQRQNTFGLGGVPPDSAFGDFTKDPRSQTGPTYPLYEGIGTP
jgi:hypothetical protein